jgi:hypothetical protein
VAKENKNQTSKKKGNGGGRKLSMLVVLFVDGYRKKIPKNITADFTI